MDHSNGMHKVVVLTRARDGTERTICGELERHLGGSGGVVEAFLAAGGAAYGVTAAASAAAER